MCEGENVIYSWRLQLSYHKLSLACNFPFLLFLFWGYAWAMDLSLIILLLEIMIHERPFAIYPLAVT